MSTRFAVGVHVLTALAMRPGAPITSARLAASAGTSAAVIRQLMMLLRDAGLVTSQLGKGGGSLLARPPDAITLREVYAATEREEVFCTHRNQPSDECPVGRQILPVLCGVMDRAQDAMMRELDAVTIADVMARIADRDVSDLPPAQGTSCAQFDL